MPLAAAILGDADVRQRTLTLGDRVEIGEGVQAGEHHLGPVRDQFLPVLLAGRAHRRRHQPEVAALVVGEDQELVAMVVHLVLQVGLAPLDDGQLRSGLVGR